MSTDADDRWLRDIRRYINSPEFRSAARAIDEARRHRSEIEAAKQSLDAFAAPLDEARSHQAQIEDARQSLDAVAEVSRSVGLTGSGGVTPAREWRRTSRDLTEHQRALMAVQALSTLIKAFDRQMRLTRWTADTMQRALATPRVAAAVEAVAEATARTVTSAPTEPTTEGDVPASEDLATLDIKALAEIDDAGLSADLAAIEDAIVAGSPLDEFLDEGAHGLVEAHKLEFARARRLYLIFVWVVWMGMLVGVDLAAGPLPVTILGSLLNALGLDAPSVARRAATDFDSRFQPEEGGSEDSDEPPLDPKATD
jgi:hypothetical protein